MTRSLVFLAVLCVVVSPCIAFAAEYHVGSGQTYATVNDVEAAVTLTDNDVIWVHPGTYPNFWIREGGGSSQSSAVQIVAWDPNNKPVFDAAGASNCAQFEDPESVYGMVGKWFLIEDLEITGAASRGIYNVSCNIVVRNCYMHDNHNGYMGGWHNARDDERGDAIFEYNEFNRCGSGAFAHPMYMEGYLAEVRYNWLHDSTGGNSYKDRSRDSVLEYNYISAGGSGYRAFQFCGFDDREVPTSTDQYALVIGNIITQNGGGNPWLFMSNERTEGGKAKNNGYMTMVNNSCYGQNLTGPVIAGDNIAVTTLHNNIFHTNCTRMFDMVQGQQTYGVVNTSYNNWVTTACTLDPAMTDTVVGTSPGWVNGAWPLGDFHLATGSQCIDAGKDSVADLPTKEYSHPCDWTARSVSGAIDIGAHEYAGGGPQPPVAEFSGNPTEGSVPLTVYFTDLSTNSPTAWDWTFGDTAEAHVQHPSHEYTTADIYTVGLTAYNSAGQDTETKVDYITVTSGGQAPVADFVGVPTNGTVPLTVDFTDQSSNNPTSWDWTFGDSGTSELQHPSHEYTTADTYTVSLTAANSYGQDTETKPDYISVSPGGGGDYYCTSAVSEGGVIQSGNHTNLQASDDSYLVVAAVKLSGRFGTKMRYTFDTGLGSLSGLTITYENHPTTQPHRQRIYVHNYSTGVDDMVDERNISSTSDATYVVPVSSPASYISATGEVQVYVRTGDIQKSGWTHNIDFLKISATP